MTQAQTAPPISNNDGYKGTSAEKVKTKFIKPEIEIKQSGLISNVLKIINTSSENLNFTLDVLIPNDWSSIINPNKTYNLLVNDTLIIPVIVVPSKLKSGNSSVIINSFILDLDGQQIGDNSFLIRTKKQVKWDIGVKTANRFYFKNEEFNKKFEYSIVNKGNYKQDISINHKIPKKDLFISDTANVEKEIVQKKNSISLDVGEEADFSYYASAIQKDERNQKKISNTNYTPYENKYFKKYDLVINSKEDKTGTKKTYKKTAKVSFIKLPNEIDMQNYGYPSIPLTMDMYIQNILADNPFMFINLRGVKQLRNNGVLTYNTNFTFSKPYYNNRFIQDVPWNIAYFDDKKSIEIGQTNTNIAGLSTGGTGIRTSYRLNNNNRVTAFYSVSKDQFQKKNNESYGASYSFFTNFFSLSTSYGRSNNLIYGRTSNIITVSPQINLFRKHRFNFSAAQSTNEYETTAIKRVGYAYTAGISSTLSRKLKFSVNGRYTDPKFGNSAIERLNANHRTSFKINSRRTINLSNSFQQTNSYLANQEIRLLSTSFSNNRINLTKKTQLGSIQNGLFYDLRDYATYQFKTRGYEHRLSIYKPEHNLQTSFNFRFGLTQEILTTPTDNLFNFDFTTLTRYKIWNFTFKYNYGFSSINPNQNTALLTKIPQLIRGSVQNQYTFKNRRFILETNTSYTYRNTANNNSFGISPSLFYFTKTNWRFSFTSSYFYNSSDYSFINFEQQQYSTANIGKTQSSNFTLGMGIRKEFGIPIPFAKKSTVNVPFIAFQDSNGNGVKEYDEVILDNIVVSLGPKEVITNPRGIAKINKVPHAKYKFNVLALEDLKGWFPQVNDSIIIDSEDVIFIPYSRGVKLYGDVIIDRQKIAITDDQPIDLSRIKITATKEKTYSTLTDSNGHFEFYLPNGEYTLTMDDSILSSKLRLSRNNIPIVLNNNQDGYYTSFYILEKRRKVIIRDFSKKKK